MVGLDNAGKTTILYQFLMNEVVHTSPTIGSNVEEIVWKNIHFLVWDLAGNVVIEIDLKMYKQFARTFDFGTQNIGNSFNSQFYLTLCIE